MPEKQINYLNLSSPTIREYEDGNDFVKTFLWKTELGNIILTISVFLKESEEFGQFFMVRSNLDSGDVRGQGKFIWNFLTNQLDLLAREKKKKVLHEVNPNEYSLHLVDNDPKYKKRGKFYYALY